MRLTSKQKEELVAKPSLFVKMDKAPLFVSHCSSDELADLVLKEF